MRSLTGAHAASVGGIRTCESELLDHLTTEPVPAKERTHGVPRRWLYHFESRFLTMLTWETLRISLEECGCARSNKVRNGQEGKPHQLPMVATFPRREPTTLCLN